MNGYLSFADRDRRLFERCHTVLALDTSGSMGESDYGGPRLQCALQAFGRLIDVKVRCYPQDVVAVVSFNDKATIRHAGAVVGTDHQALLTCMAGVQPDGRTAIGLALPPARRILFRLLGRHTGRRTRSQLILLTDGENNTDPDPVEVATEMKDDGIWVDVIGIGKVQDLDTTCLRSVASTRPDGTPSYRFIGDQESLGNHLAELAQHYLIPL
jgi:Mg-chelatase subunit ChlD